MSNLADKERIIIQQDSDKITVDLLTTTEPITVTDSKGVEKIITITNKPIVINAGNVGKGTI
tara:strand:- start:289 stop:474 length:186 start_codon:yes stop_codon:yes gene_type:complete